jgi:class 3 adenylate cyclase
MRELENWRVRGRRPSDAGRRLREGRAYAVIGTVTNQAARLCSAAEDGQILVAERLLAKVGQLVETVSVGEPTLEGFRHPVRAHDIVRMRS